MNCFCIKTQHFVSCIPLSGFSVKAARSFLSCLSKKAGQFPLPVPQKKTRFPRIMGGSVFYFVFSSLLRPALLRHPLFLRPPASLRRPLGGRFVNLHKERHMFLCNLAQQKSRMQKHPGSGGRGWIRTTEALSSRFTVCPHWPLGNTPLFCLAGRCILPGDSFILPQALRFVNSFFEFFQSRFSRLPCPPCCGASGRAGLLAYFSTRQGVCQQAILLLGAIV